VLAIRLNLIVLNGRHSEAFLTRTEADTRTMKLSILFLLVATVLNGCSPRSTTSPPVNSNSSSRPLDAKTRELQAKLKAITVGDGISNSEAELIATCYFHQNVGCGVFTVIRDGGEYWLVDGAFGYAAEPIVGFHIDKKSGKVTSPIGPSYESPSELFL